MSNKQKMNVTCPVCGTKGEASAWQTLNADTQQLLRDAVAAGYGYVTDTCWGELENQKVAINEQYGIVFYDMTDEERGAYRAEVLQYYFDKGQADDWDMELYDVIQSYA